jgi:hypothetical protein
MERLPKLIENSKLIKCREEINGIIKEHKQKMNQS